MGLNAELGDFVPGLGVPQIAFHREALLLVIFPGPDFKVVEDAHQDDVLVQAGVLSQCGRDEDALLDLAPIREGVGEQAVVHPGDHQAVGVVRADPIPEPGGDHDPALVVESMERAAAKHACQFSATFHHFAPLNTNIFKVSRKK